MKFKTTAGNEETLLSIDVNIDDTNKIEKLEIFPSDDPYAVVNAFCRIHGISEEKKNKLQKIIEDKLNDNVGSSSNRS